MSPREWAYGESLFATYSARRSHRKSVARALMIDALTVVESKESSPLTI